MRPEKLPEVAVATRVAKASFTSTHPPPDDKFGQVYWIVAFVGIICMMPWDMLMTVNGYWEYKLRNASIDDLYDDPDDPDPPLTRRQKMFMSYLSVASSVPGAVVIISHAFLGNRISINLRAVVSLVGMTAAFMGILVLALVDSDDWTSAFMGSNLGLAVVINIFRALLQATNSANMGKFPVKYMGSLANGVCLGGLIPVVVNIVILTTDVDIQMAGFGCFAFAFSLALLCLALYLYMEKLEFYRFYTYLDENILSEKSGRVTHSPRVTLPLAWSVLSRCWLLALALLVTGLTTTAVYPGALSLVRPAHVDDGDWDDVYFTQVTCYLNFNIFNCLGTAVAGIVQWPYGTSPNAQMIVLLWALLRLVFIPIFMMCNLAPSRRTGEVFFASDVVFVLLVASFSFSDGYLTNTALMFGPKTAEDDGLQEVTAGLLVATLATAITLGSILGTAVVRGL